jgi:chorismate mutase
MPYSRKEISQLYHASCATLDRRIKELKQTGKFKKESPGVYYSEKEVKTLAELLEFTFQPGTGSV